jgi:virginiamycin B lyase
VAGCGHLYWANDYNIGRANLNGTDVDQNFIADPSGGPSGLAVNSRYLYWTNEYRNTIGRALLNGTRVNQRFITGASFPETGLAIDSRYIYWTNNFTGTIGRARLDGTGVNQKFFTVPNGVQPFGLRGVAVDPGR